CRHGYKMNGGQCISVWDLNCLTEPSICKEMDVRAECDADTGMCVCPDTYIQKNNTCITECTNESCQVLDINSVCGDANMCSCRDGFIHDNATNICVLLYQMNCSSNASICEIVDPNSRCINDLCGCKAGYSIGPDSLCIN
ncbi:unnamed protein product, partial [Owenia fusiformis]